MNSVNQIKNGFSLIEILISLGVIILIMVAVFFTYNKVKINQSTSLISDDFKYSISNLEQNMNVINRKNLTNKKGCCEMISFIDSNLPLISEKPAFGGGSISAEALKKYKSPLGGEIDIIMSYANDGKKIM